MKPIYLTFVLSLVGLAGCSTMHRIHGVKAETVMVSYHVLPTKDADFQALLARAWQVYKSEHLVFAEPHVLVRETGNGGMTRFVEIFTWVKAPDHAPASVQKVWKQEQSLCEARNGHTGIEGGEVQLIAGR